MPPSYAEWKQRSGESVGTTHMASAEMALGLLKTSAVSFEHLTGNEHWDRFLSHVQDRLEVKKKEQVSFLELCGSSGEEGILRMAQLQYQYATGYIKALEELVTLPHQVMDAYVKVKG